MARFVNYQKRGVELPPGCKDLIDVLKRKQKAEGPGAFAGNWEPMPNADFFPSGGIRQIERYVTRVLSSARFAVLLVMSLDGRVLIQLARNPGEAAFDLVLLAQPDDQGLEQLLDVARDPDDGWVAEASEILTFARLALASNEAARRDCPLWLVGNND